MTRTACAVLAALGAAPATAAAPETAPASWLDRMPAEDRACLERGIGFAPPEFAEGLRWIGGEPETWEALRGDVVVIQSWTHRTASGRNWIRRVAEIVGGAPDVRLLALHTPEGAETAEAYLERHPVAATPVIDTDGAFSDRLGAYDRPVNVVIDRGGAVRYVGLAPQGLEKAIAALRAEPPEDASPRDRATGDGPEAPAAYPPVTGQVKYAQDIRGRDVPAMRWSEWRWLNGRPPDIDGKVLLIDLWATWCAPCRRGIQHLNELAERYADDLVVIGLSDERPEAFEKGLRRYNLTPEHFSYPVALDPGGRLARAIRVQGIPHVIVASADGIARWQGRPSQLDDATLQRIIAANRGGEGDLACRRWAKR